VLESLERALSRNARIYAEVMGGSLNSGGQRGGGSLTAPNAQAVRRCIRSALDVAGTDAAAIDSINGHLTGTARDAEEVQNWAGALNRSGSDFPYINSFKGLIGHSLAAAGSIECVGTLLQFRENQLFGNANCDDLHPEIEKYVHGSRVPIKSKDTGLHTIAKASFGFGDVNACVIFKRYNKT
jgi:3-oxoacyl-(acyl-carrier-protein) synthase